MVPEVLLEPYMSQGDQGVAETPIVSKGLRNCRVRYSIILKFNSKIERFYLCSKLLFSENLFAFRSVLPIILNLEGEFFRSF